MVGCPWLPLAELTWYQWHRIKSEAWYGTGTGSQLMIDGNQREWQEFSLATFFLIRPTPNCIHQPGRGLGRTICQTHQLETSVICEVTFVLSDGPMRFRGHWYCSRRRFIPHVSDIKIRVITLFLSGLPSPLCCWPCMLLYTVSTRFKTTKLSLTMIDVCGCCSVHQIHCNSICWMSNFFTKHIFVV